MNYTPTFDFLIKDYRFKASVCVKIQVYSSQIG